MEEKLLLYKGGPWQKWLIYQLLFEVVDTHDIHNSATFCPVISHISLKYENYK